MAVGSTGVQPGLYSMSFCTSSAQCERLSMSYASLTALTSSMRGGTTSDVNELRLANLIFSTRLHSTALRAAASDVSFSSGLGGPALVMYQRMKPHSGISPRAARPEDCAASRGPEAPLPSTTTHALKLRLKLTPTVIVEVEKMICALAHSRSKSVRNRILSSSSPVPITSTALMPSSTARAYIPTHAFS